MSGLQRLQGELWVEAEPSSLARAEPDRPELARTFIDDRATHSEQARELASINQRTAGCGSAGQSLDNQVGEPLELIVIQARDGPVQGSFSASW